MSVDIQGLDDVIALLDKTAREPAKFSKTAQSRLQRAVDRERNNHAYQNRSHSAETNTLLLQVGSGADVDLRVEMMVEYASFLQNRNGKKWSKFDELVKAAFGDIDTEARKL